MIFKTFDAEKDPISQGFAEGSYDLIVAFFVIHATSDLQRALRHIRRMLKPGGWLVVGEGQEGMNGVASSGFIFGTLPGWWLGTDTGRVISPHVSPQDWEDLLRKTGFSGVDSCPRKEFEDVLNVFHFASQATDEETHFFRDPLASTWHVPSIKKLVMVGGRTERSLRLVDGLRSLLTKYADETYIYESLLEVDYNYVDNDSTIVSFTELDEPVFKNITSTTFEPLKAMFHSDKNMLWVTSGRRDDEPYSNMTVGFGRVASHESPGLRLQQLDIADPTNITCESLAKIVLQFHAGRTRNEEMLWSVEPEIVVDELNRQLVARLRPITKMNQRYNSTRRAIVEERDINQTPFTLQNIEGFYTIKEQSKYDIPLSEHHSSEELLELHTTHAIASAIKTNTGYGYLVIGEHPKSRKQHLALVSDLSSVIMVPAASTTPTKGLGLSNEALLKATAAQIVAMVVVGPLLKGQTLVAHNVPIEVASAISDESTTKGVHVIYTTDDLRTAPSSHVRLPQYLSRSDLEDIMLAKPSAFIGLSNGASDNERTLISMLPQECFIITKQTLYASKGSIGDACTTMTLASILRHATQRVQKAAELRAQNKFTSISIGELANGTILEDPLTVLDWRASSVLPIHAARLDTSPMFKSSNATYWIVGMAGALGISLCDWMIDAGARNIVMTTRNPKIAPEWIEAHKRKGATITILPW
jgi:hypothetical protein